MKVMTPSLLHPFAYGLWAALVVGSIVFAFDKARRRELVHDRTILPLVTRERALGFSGFWEIRERGSLCIMAKGLSFTEMLPEQHSLWRHGLAPATVVTVAPRQEVARMEYVFDNAHDGQVMTIRVGGREVARRGPLGEERVDGEVEIPASTEELIVEIAFSSWAQAPPPDTRKITVTFRKLTLCLQ
jgi:hypothetical protein